MLSSWNYVVLSVLVIAWAGFYFLRPSKDYYVLQRSYFRRLHESPWRGMAEGIHHRCFTDYLAAKAAFDVFENYKLNTDPWGNEAEHSLFLVPAKSKAAAISRLKAGNAYDKQLLNQTPFAEVSNGRKEWLETQKSLGEHQITLAELSEKRS